MRARRRLLVLRPIVLAALLLLATGLRRAAGEDRLAGGIDDVAVVCGAATPGSAAIAPLDPWHPRESCAWRRPSSAGSTAGRRLRRPARVADGPRTVGSGHVILLC